MARRRTSKPHAGSPLFVVEKRDANGRLRFDGGEEPPREWLHGVTQWSMTQWYYARHPGSPSVDMATIYAYMWEQFGWRVRAKYW